MMNDKDGVTGLEFFGVVTASISHDINNRLAVINENAGLLDDYVQMYRNGGEMDTEKLSRVAASLKRNVSRANEIVKMLNRFAHSADRPEAQVDLRDVLTLTAALANRIAEMRDVSISLDPDSEPATVTTSVYHLLNVIWLCINGAVESTPPGGTVNLKSATSGTHTVLSIGLEPANGIVKNIQLPESSELLARELGMSVVANQADGTVVIRCC